MTFLESAAAAALAVLMLAVPSVIALFVWERGPALFRRLWAWVTKKSQSAMSDDYYFPPANLADRYKALLKKREEDAAKASELLRKQQDVVVALRSQMLEIVRTETGLELSFRHKKAPLDFSGGAHQFQATVAVRPPSGDDSTLSGTLAERLRLSRQVWACDRGHVRTICSSR
jgi:hypothetical protein